MTIAHGLNRELGLIQILVIMEDAPPTLKKPFTWKRKSCLNPCCNGRCPPTNELNIISE
jgi:hypothetical protein